MKRLHAICFGLLVLSGFQAPVAAIAGAAGGYAGGRVPLGCTMLDGTVIAITNTSGATVPEGAAITYDALSSAYGVHYGKVFVSAALAPGEVVRKQASASDSCVAWFTLPATATPASPPSPAPAPASAPPEQKP